MLEIVIWPCKFFYVVKCEDRSCDFDFNSNRIVCPKWLDQFDLTSLPLLYMHLCSVLLTNMGLHFSTTASKYGCPVVICLQFVPYLTRMTYMSWEGVLEMWIMSVNVSLNIVTNNCLVFLYSWRLSMCHNCETIFIIFSFLSLLHK